MDDEINVLSITLLRLLGASPAEEEEDDDDDDEEC
jgi:hypothetical protein